MTALVRKVLRMSIVGRSDQQVPRRPFRSDITIIASLRDEDHSSSLSFTCRDVLFVSRVQVEHLVTDVFPDDKHMIFPASNWDWGRRLSEIANKLCARCSEGEALLQVSSTCSESKLVEEQPRDVKRVNRQDLLLKCSLCEVGTPKTHVDVIILYL